MECHTHNSKHIHMDLGEILSYKPATSSKRTRDDENEEELPPTKTSRKVAADDQNGLTNEEKLRLLQSVDDDDDQGLEDLDSTAVKRLLLGFEKQVHKNQEMRVKFPDQPEKFMESEIELNEEIQKLHVISTVPELYNILIETNIVQTLVGLLLHDNSDIAIAVVDLIQQLTDAELEDDGKDDDEGEGQRGGTEKMVQLIDQLLEQQIIPLLVQNLERLDEKVREDSDGVHMTLAIIENMCEYMSTEVTKKAGQQGLMIWLLKRVRVRQYDGNKLYSSEVLAILLQDNEPNQQLLGDTDGIDILLQSLAYYKKRDPHSTDEVELMENIFDCLCSALMYTPNRDKFLKGEGLQLMRLMLQSKKLARRSALKVLNHAMCTGDGRDNCVKFVEIFGLGSLFPAFMKTAKPSRKTITLEREHEEHVSSIIASLFRNTSGPAKDRLVSKFLENDHEKVDRLMELHLQYLKQVQKADRALDNEDEDDETEMLLRRMDAGLFTLQQVDYIITELCVCGIASIKSRINTILGLRGESLDLVRVVMKEYYLQVMENKKEGSKEDEEWIVRLDTIINEL